MLKKRVVKANDERKTINMGSGLDQDPSSGGVTPAYG